MPNLKSFPVTLPDNSLCVTRSRTTMNLILRMW